VLACPSHEPTRGLAVMREVVFAGSDDHPILRGYQRGVFHGISCEALFVTDSSILGIMRHGHRMRFYWLRPGMGYSGPDLAKGLSHVTTSGRNDQSDHCDPLHSLCI
jgi:hypothetical protein